MKKLLFLFLILAPACYCSQTKKGQVASASNIDETAIKSAIDSVKTLYPSVEMSLLEKGVRHASSLWRAEDGTTSEFTAFVKGNYAPDLRIRNIVFRKVSGYFESLLGNYNEITIDLKKNPDATPAGLKESVVNTIARDTWNIYFAGVFGIKDSPVLAIYSHMVNSPLYVAKYSYGQIIQFQLEEFLRGKKLSDEIEHIYSQGSLIPQQWIMGATGSKISAQPILNAIDEVLK